MFAMTTRWLGKSSTNGKTSRKLASYQMLVFAFVLGPIVAFANIGVVDLQKAVQGTTAGKKAKETMDGEFKKRKDALDKKKADIEKMAQDLEKKRPVLSDEVFNKKNNDIQEEMGKFQKTVVENQTEIQKKEQEVVSPILDKMRKVIEKLAVEKKLDLVLDKQAPGVLYSKKEVDFTDDLIKVFEKEK